MKKESIMNRKHFYIIAGIFILALAGCSIKKEDTKKIQDIEFTVVAPEDVPEELKADIEKARDTPFRLTYADQGYLYMARGYGEKEKTALNSKGKTEPEKARAFLLFESVFLKLSSENPLFNEKHREWAMGLVFFATLQGIKKERRVYQTKE